MPDNVSLFKPKARGRLRRDTGGVDLSVPVPFGDGKHSVRIGITLLGAPLDALTEDPAGSKKLEQALFEAFTGDIQVRWNNDKAVATMPLFKAVAETVEAKMKDTL